MFRAVHIFGPMQDTDVAMASATIPRRLWYAPVPEGVAAPFPNGYMTVGVNTPPLVPFPGQVEYVLDLERSALAIGFDSLAVSGSAVFILAGDVL
jgi:hypothetical protein